jgi:hypothetical protein
MYPHNKFIKGKENIPLLFVLKHNLLCLSQHCTSYVEASYTKHSPTASLHSVLNQNNNRTQQMSATWSITYFFKK